VVRRVSVQVARRQRRQPVADVHLVADTDALELEAERAEAEAAGAAALGKAAPAKAAKAARKKLDEAISEYACSGTFPLKIAVDGVRFPNEEAYLRGLPAFEMWHIHRADAPQVAGHTSEVEQKNITVHVDTDVVLQNNGTIAQLLAIVDMVFIHHDTHGGGA
jgi:hypothetical protein